MSALADSGWTSTMMSPILQAKKVGLIISCQPDIAPDSCNLVYRFLTVVSSAPRRDAMVLRADLNSAPDPATALSYIRARKILTSSSSVTCSPQQMNLAGRECSIYSPLPFCLVH